MNRSIASGSFAKGILLVIFVLTVFQTSTTTARAWHIPELEILSPLNGDNVNGIVHVDVAYSVANGNVHTIQLRIDGQLADSMAVHEQSGTYTFTWNSASETDGPHTIEVRAYTAAPPSDHFNKETITIHVSNALCRSDADCDDQDDHTQDTCANPGTPDAACIHAPIACLNNAECNDSDPLTLDSCQNAGTSESLCVNTAIQCNNNTDCNDSDTHTQDVCLNGGTVSATCQHNAIACLNDAECNDSNPLTLDSCQNPGMASSACVNAPIACNTNTDCSDSDAHTEDICQNGGMANAACQYNPIACLNDAECNDNDASTIDSCQNAGSASSLCVNTQTACLTNADCDDSNDYTQDTCNEGGTVNAACAHAPIACLTNTDCNDSDPLTLDECQNPGTTASSCSNTAILCNTNSDCDDSDSLTQDVCVNGGTAASSCAHDPLACNRSSDCNDGNDYTIDQCVNPGTTTSACTHTAIACLTNEDCNDSNDHTLDACHSNGTQNASCSHDAIACLNNGDCDDDNPLTLDSCSNPGTAGASCAHISVSCLADTDCNDGNALTLDSCQNPGASNASCVNSPIACITNMDCDDSNAYTIDNCSNGGGAIASCSHVSIACVSDSDCDDGKSSTTDACINSGSATAACQHTEEQGHGTEEDPLSPLSLVVTSPQDMLLTNQPSLTVKGTSHPQALVTVNGISAPVTDTGKFTLTIMLSEGENEIAVKACRSQECRTEVRSLSLDTNAPYFISMSPNDGSLFTCSQKSIDMEIYLSDGQYGSGLDPASISLSANGGDVAFHFSISSGKLFSEVPMDQCGQTIVVVINASDKAGNVMPAIMARYVQQPESGSDEYEELNYAKGFVYASSDGANYRVLINNESGNATLSSEPSYVGKPWFNGQKLAYTVHTNNTYQIHAADIVERNGQLLLINDTAVTDSGIYNSEAALSANGSILVYVSNIDGEYALFAKDLVNGTNRRLSLGMNVIEPALSPDGLTAVFTASKDGTYAIYAVATDNSQPITAVTAPILGIDTNPVFSPDGQHIFFSSNRDGHFDIYRIDKSGRDLTRITDTPDREVRLVFNIEGELLCSIKRDGKYGIYKVNTASGEVTSVVSNSLNNLPR